MSNYCNVLWSPFFNIMLPYIICMFCCITAILCQRNKFMQALYIFQNITQQGGDGTAQLVTMTRLWPNVQLIMVSQVRFLSSPKHQNWPGVPHSLLFTGYQGTFGHGYNIWVIQCQGQEQVDLYLLSPKAFIAHIGQLYLYKHDKSFTLISSQFIILYMLSLVSVTLLLSLIKIKAEKDVEKFHQNTWPWNLIHVSMKAMNA